MLCRLDDGCYEALCSQLETCALVSLASTCKQLHDHDASCGGQNTKAGRLGARLRDLARRLGEDPWQRLTTTLGTINWSDRGLGAVDARCLAWLCLFQPANVRAMHLLLEGENLGAFQLQALLPSSGATYWTPSEFRTRRTLGPVSITFVTVMIKRNTTLTSITLGNSLYEEGALNIVRAARQHDKLTSLGLALCDIGPSGAKEVAEYVSSSTVLKRLVLSSNQIKDEGAIALSKALKSNTTLEELKLDNCGIGAEGGKALASALLEGGMGLNKLDMGYNGCYEAKPDLRDAIQGRKRFELFLPY